MLSRTLIAASWRDLRGRTWQIGLMVLGVALGVAVVVAINLANESATRAFELSTEAVVGRATHRIEGGPDGVPADLLADLKEGGEVGALAPVVEAYGVAPGLDDRPLRLLGVDPLSERPFRDFFAGGAILRTGFERFYTQPYSVLLSSSLADEAGLEPGDELRFQISDRLIDLKVLGVLSAPDGSGRSLPSDLALMDVATAQEILGKPNRISRIDVIATQKQAAVLRGSLPPGLSLEPASERAQTAADLSDAFQLNLTALSLLALVVGMFLIYNTVMFSVVQRRRVLAILRALGVTGRQLFALILFEAIVVGTVGALLGVGLGWALAQGAVRLVSQTITDFYFVVSVRQASLTLSTAVFGLAMGVGSSIVAAAAPGLEAASVSPVSAMRRSSLEGRVRNWLPLVSAAGLLLGGLGIALLFLLPASLTASFAGMFGIVLGVALLVPQLTVWLMALAGGGLRWIFGVVGGISARTVVRALSRTSVAIAALMVALSVTIGVGIMIDSFRVTVENWLDLTLRADVYVRSPAAGGTRPSAELDPDLGDRLRGIDGVAAVETFRAVTVDSEFGEIQLSVADAKRERDARLYRFAIGSPAEVWQRVQSGAVIVSEPFAFQHGLPPQAGEVTLETERGPVTFPVVGVYYDYATDRGTVLMADTTYRRYWGDRAVSSFALYLQPGAELRAVTEEARSHLAGTGLLVQANRTIRQQALGIFDRTFAITSALRVLAVVVAFIGVLSALLALQLERGRELATLKALGLTDRGMWGLTLLETGLMGATAGMLSLPTGVIMALVLIYVINLRSFGWTIQMALDPWIFAQALAVAVVAALLAGIYPLRRQNRLEVSDALRQE